MYESTLFRLNHDEKLKLVEQDSEVLNSSLPSPTTIKELPTKPYVDSLHEINRNTRDLSLGFNDHGNDFDNNKITILDSITVNRDPSSDNELASKKDVDDSIGGGNFLGFNQTLQHLLKVSVATDTYILTKYGKIQITDTTVIKYPSTGGYLLQNWVIKCNDKNKHAKVQTFKKQTKTNILTGYSGATSLPPICESLMYIDTSSNTHGNNVYVRFERTDIIQTSNMSFYYNSFSVLTNDPLKSMGRFKNPLLLEDNTWNTRYNIPKNECYSDFSTDLTKLSLIFTVRNYGIKLIYDEIDTPHADMCFSIITKTHFEN